MDLTEIVRQLLTTGDGLDGVHLGIDVVDIPAFEKLLSNPGGEAFAARVYTRSELADCRGSVDRLATRWAAKEAVAKAIGCGFRDGLHSSSIEVVKAHTGQPSVRPASGRTWPNAAASWRWAVSMSHDGAVAVAAAIAITSSTSHTSLDQPNAGYLWPLEQS